MTLTRIFLCYIHIGLGNQDYVYRRHETTSRQARVGCAARLSNILMAQELCCHASDDRIVAFADRYHLIGCLCQVIGYMFSLLRELKSMHVHYNF